MCKVHNPVGCLTTIKKHLKRHQINEFNSLNEVIRFQKNFPVLKQQIIAEHEQLIEKEKVSLEEEIAQLDNTIQTDKAYFENSFLSEIEEVKQRLNNVSSVTGLNFYLIGWCPHQPKFCYSSWLVKTATSKINVLIKYGHF